MTTINNTYINALFADATCEHKIDPTSIVGALKTNLSLRMTPTLADYISSNFSVVTQIQSGDLVGSGFDATVWHQTDGKLFFSMRGTEPGQDLFVTDAASWGDDFLDGGEGDDLLWGNGGNDRLVGQSEGRHPEAAPKSIAACACINWSGGRLGHQKRMAKPKQQPCRNRNSRNQTALTAPK